MSSLNDLLRQSQILLEVFDDLKKLLKEAQNKLIEENFDNTEMFYLKDAFNKTLTLSNLYLKNFNEFMKDQKRGSQI